MGDQELFEDYLEFIKKIANHAGFSSPSREEVLIILRALKPINESWDNRTGYCSYVYIENKPYDDVYEALGKSSYRLLREYEKNEDFRQLERLIVHIDNNYSWLKRLQIKELMD